MSLFYGIDVTITGHRPERTEAIRRAGDLEVRRLARIGRQVELLCRGQSGGGKKNFSRQMIKRIWRANEACCEGFVRATYLEGLPYEEYTLDEDDYEQWAARGKSEDEDPSEEPREEEPS